MHRERVGPHWEKASGRERYLTQSFWRKRFDRDSPLPDGIQKSTAHHGNCQIGSVATNQLSHLGFTILPSAGFTSIRQILTPCGCGRTNWDGYGQTKTFFDDSDRTSRPHGVASNRSPTSLPYSTISRTKLGLSWELRSLRW